MLPETLDSHHHPVDTQGMASIQKRTQGTTTSYRVSWRQDGQQRSRTFDRYRDALAHKATTEHQLATGTYIAPTKQTFGDYARSWQAMQVHRATTAAQVDSHLRRHVLPVLEHRPLAQIRRSEVQALVKGLSTKLEPATVEVVYRYLSTILKAAVADQLIPANPCTGTKLPKKERRLVEPLATEVVQALMAEVPPRYRALVVLAASTGLRQGECFGLTVDRIDFLRRSVRVDRQLVMLTGEPALCPPKTAASVRTVPLPEIALVALSEHLRAYPAGPEGLVSTNEKGQAIRRNRFAEMWRRATREVAPGVHFHDLRHYYASLLIRAGESVKVVQSRLGHASASETLDTYSHLWPDSDDRTRAAVDAILTPEMVVAVNE